MTKKTSLWQRLKHVFGSAQTPAPESDIPSQANANNSTRQMIVDLVEQRQPDTQSANPTVIANDIDVMLASMGYQFSYHPPRILGSSTDNRPLHHFSMQVSDGEREWGCLLRFFEKEQLFAVYSIFPFSVPDSHRGEMSAVISYLNYDLVLGNLELDIHDGELRFKTSLDLEVTGLSPDILAYLLHSNFGITSRLHDTLWDVVQKSAPAGTASEAVESLLLAQQANTFYLMTDVYQ